MSVQKNDIMNFIQRNNLEDSIICLHSSLKSFGFVEGGANAVLDAFMECGCTLVCPAFYWKGFLPPQKNYTQNGMDYESTQKASYGLMIDSISYEENPEQIDVSMGIIPKTLLTYPQAIRTKNPMNSFCVAGQLADKLVNGHTANIVDSVYTAYTVTKIFIWKKVQRLLFFWRELILLPARLFILQKKFLEKSSLDAGVCINQLLQKQNWVLVLKVLKTCVPT
jgi:hypothetical protein